MIKKLLPLLVVILAGETIFMHPFLVPRLYRSLMMDVWGISNTDVGVAFSSYGLTAMLSYIFGGPFADKYEPRGLMVISLLVTALGSSLLFFNPSSTTLIIAYGFFGVSTIFLMWSAMIKVTHEIGGESSRGSAMGILEGGRGLVAAMMSTFLVFLVGMNTNKAGEILDKTWALNSIYLSISIFMVFVSIIVWFVLKDVETKQANAHDWTLEKAKKVFSNLNLWLLAIIILSAYCSYKNVGNYSVYMRDVKGMSIVESSTFTSY
ncbi:MAG: MFS family permease, partial [Thermoproteota archaeon]